jgi:hypothetical protein
MRVSLARRRQRPAGRPVFSNKEVVAMRTESLNQLDTLVTRFVVLRTPETFHDLARAFGRPLIDFAITLGAPSTSAPVAVVRALCAGRSEMERGTIVDADCLTSFLLERLQAEAETESSTA